MKGTDPITRIDLTAGIYINVKSPAYGAIGDGATDDRTAIQLADAAAALIGGAVYFPATADFYYVTGSLHPSSNTTWFGDGSGSQIKCPSSGWTLSTTDDFGIIGIIEQSNIRITGLRITGTNSVATATTAPKLIYLEGSVGTPLNNITIDHNYLDTSVDEGIWQGGFQNYNTGIRITNNYLTNISYKGTVSGGLPAIQLNVENAVIANNQLYQVGTGIGASGARMTITGNQIRDFSSAGISTGDGGENGIITIAGNTVEFNEQTSGNPRFGILLEGGAGADHLINVSGNVARLVGTAPIGTAQCYKVSTATQVQMIGNTAEIQVRGIGFYALGSTAGTSVEFKSNVVRVVAESGASYGFLAIPNGGGQTLTLLSSNNNVYGTTSAQGSYAYSYTAPTGTLILNTVDDLKTDGRSNIGGNQYDAGVSGTEILGVPLQDAMPDTAFSSFFRYPRISSLNLQPSINPITIASGVLTISGTAASFYKHQTLIRVETEGVAATDDLDTIAGGQDGDIIILLSADSTHDTTVKNGTGNIQCGSDFTLATVRDRMMLIYDGATSKWVQLSRSTN